MKTLILLTMAALTASVVFAGDTKPENKERAYLLPEISFDTYGTARFNDDHTKFGGGVGVNAFFHNNFGIGVEAESENPESGLFLESLNAKVIARVPYGALTPSVFAGGGYNFEPESYTLFAGAGVELKLTERAGLFADARWNVPEHDTVSRGHASARVGVRFKF